METKNIYIQKHSILAKAINLLSLFVLGFLVYSVWTSDYISDVGTHEIKTIKDWNLQKVNKNPVPYLEGVIREIDKTFEELEGSKLELEGILNSSQSEIEVLNDTVNFIREENEDLKIMFLNEDDVSIKDALRVSIENNLIVIGMHEGTINDNQSLVTSITNDLNEIDNAIYDLRKLSADYQVALRSAVSRDAIKAVSLPNPEDFSKMRATVQTLNKSFKRQTLASAASQKLRIKERDMQFNQFINSGLSAKTNSDNDLAPINSDSGS